MFFSSFIPLIFFLVMKLASNGKLVSFLSSLIILCETSLLCNGRLVHPNSFFPVISLLSLCCIIYWFGLVRNEKQWKIFMLLSSISTGIAVSSHKIAYAMIPVVFFHELIYLYIESNYKINKTLAKNIMKRYITFIIPLFLVQGFISFIYHCFVLSPEQLETIQKLKEPSNFKIFQYLLSIPYYAQKHAYKKTDSRVIDWIFMGKLEPIMWRKNNRCAIFFGNIFVYIISFAGIIISISFIQNRRYFRVATFFMLYIFSLFFCYFLEDKTADYYLLPLICGVASYGSALDIFFKPYLKAYFMTISVIISYYGYNRWSPFSYSETVNIYVLSLHLWRNSWSLIFT